MGHSVAEGVVDSTVFGEGFVELFEGLQNGVFHVFFLIEIIIKERLKVLH